MTKTRSDYRNAKYATKASLNSILGVCGEKSLSEEQLKKTSKAELVEKVQKAQNEVLAQHGRLYPGEY